MAETQAGAAKPEAKEKEPAEAAAAAVPGKSILASPVVIGVIVVLVAGAGYIGFAAKGFSKKEEKPKPVLELPYADLSLGTFSRYLTFRDEEGIGETDRFQADVTLMLNPKHGDVALLKTTLTLQKAFLQDRVNRLLMAKDQEAFYTRGFLASFGTEIRNSINEYYGYNEKGDGVIAEVLFPTDDSMLIPR